MVILPSSFAGSPRAQQQAFQDAMAVVAKFGYPSLFITMTTNPKWREIVENIPVGDQATNHPMLVSRVFKCKSDALLDDIIKRAYLRSGRCQAGRHRIPKRGLPHIHILIILIDADRIRDAQQIDRIVSAEIPSPTQEPDLYDLVSRHMIHGPCGALNPHAPCMVDGKCTKGFQSHSQRRPSSPNRVESPTADGPTGVKYLYKYILKGPDRAAVRIGIDLPQEGVHDEIENFVNARYVSPPEAAWHILQFPMMRNTHTTYRLSFTCPKDRWSGFSQVSKSKPSKARTVLLTDTAAARKRRHKLRRSTDGRRSRVRHFPGSVPEQKSDGRRLRVAKGPPERPPREMPFQLRSMFASMLIFCDITDRLALKTTPSNGPSPTSKLSYWSTAPGYPIWDCPNRGIVDFGANNVVDIQAEHAAGEILRNQLNGEQSAVFEAIMRAVHDENEPNRLIFLNAAAGAGPLHSRFKLPLEINETSTAGVTPRSSDGRLIRSAKLIVIDEVCMVTKSILKMVEAALRDICDDNRPGTIVEECIKTSLTHFRFVRHNLLHNVRAEQDQQDFSRWLLELGNGTLPAFRRTPYGNLIQIPEQCVANSKEELMTFCLGNLDFAFISNKALLSPLNTTCHDINDQAIRKLPGVPKTYTSADSIDVTEQPDVEYANYSVEFLNSLTPSGFPPPSPHPEGRRRGRPPAKSKFEAESVNGTRLLIHVLGSRFIKHISND
ncbi:hypothetical protein NQ318_008346 [Aromia moschata]|uniref:ATP-dependent DNA helicase n=1 Tax=Aromia moschata TaxID=1265417 RepID=A0AAV8YI68_9CUCU|nr:hypothetical protein NQ318_008346 [Aromia moschata]